jgi:hypothetical protein
VGFVHAGIASREPFDNAGKLLLHVRVIDAVNLCEGLPHMLRVLRLHSPDIRIFGIGVGICVGSARVLNVEHIFEARVLRVCSVNERNSL